MKKHMLKAVMSIAFACAMAATAKAVGNGNVYEFRPITPVTTVDAPDGIKTAGQSIKFTMRLIAPNPTAALPEKPHQWEIYYKPSIYTPVTPEDIQYLWAMSPLRLGVVVSGQIRPCSISLPFPTEGGNGKFQDITCEYVVKDGDLALPLKLALTADGHYIFVDERGDVNKLWGIRDANQYATDGTIVDLEAKIHDGESGMAPEYPRNGSIDLAWGFGGEDNADRAYFVKTVDFDGQSVTEEATGKTWWRVVNEGRTKYKPDEPTIVFDNLPDNPVNQYLYVWSENQDAVTMQFTENAADLKNAGVYLTNMVDRTGVPRDFWVRKIKVDGARPDYSFDFKGVAQGKTATIVLSAQPGYTFHNNEAKPEQLLLDFLTREVKCIEPLLPTVTIKVNGQEHDDVTVNTIDGVATRIATLTVELSDLYNDEAFDVTFEPQLAVDNVAVASATNYFGCGDGTKPASERHLEKTFKVAFEKGGSEKTKTMYLYAWGADDKTSGIGKSVVFMPKVVGAGAEGVFGDRMESASLKVMSIQPTIVEPVEEKLIEVQCATPYSLRLVVKDTYNDMKSTNGFEVLVRHDANVNESPAPYNDGFMLLGRFAPDDDGVLYSVPTNSTDVKRLPEITWYNVATKEALLYVRSPESRQVSELRKLKLAISAAPEIHMVTTDGREGSQYFEGDVVNVEISLVTSDGEPCYNNTGAPIYAFLVPKGEATNAVSASWLCAKGKTGRPITASGYKTSGYFTLIDGTKESKQGAAYDFEIELRDKENYSEGKKINGYSPVTMQIFSLNVIPSVEYVELNGGVESVSVNGGMFEETKVSKGVTNSFQLVVNEPGEYDLKSAAKPFKTRWRVVEKGKTPVVVTLDGDANTNVFQYAFTKTGTNTIEVQLQDKDMNGRWGNGVENEKFTFHIEVVDNPLITVTTGDDGSWFYESEAEDPDRTPELKVKMSMNPYDEPLKVELTIVPTSPLETDNRGILELQTSSVCTKDAAKSIGGTNVYVIAFDGLEQSIGVKTLDGTLLTQKPGFLIKTQVLDHKEYPNVPGEYSDTYIKGRDSWIFVRNEEPIVDRGTLSPTLNVTNRVAIGYGTEISWEQITDVAADFETGAGMTVMFTGGGGTTNIVITNSLRTAGSWKPYFEESGIYSVRMTVKDKDGGRSETFEWWYEVEMSKKLYITPHGPTGGKGTALSKNYRTAPGLGQGHVYAGVPTRVANFESVYNCGLAKTYQVWGFGYKVADAYDDGSLNGGRDFALTPTGNAVEGTVVKENCYVYPPTEPELRKLYIDGNGNLLDSFLYAWLQVTRQEGSTTLSDELLGGVMAPEYALVASDAGTTVGLPNEVDDDGLYDDTTLEAIFSREYYATDNMGDINHDKVPDIYVDKYGMGIVDPVTHQKVGDDVNTSLEEYNEDADYLPATGTAPLSSWVPGLKGTWAKVGQPFGAALEIRGFGDGLNDAPQQLGLTGVAPELVYTDPHEDSRSTLTYAEYLAWCEFAAIKHPDEENAHTNAAYFTEWSPECPTDPTKADTDGDGFDDGYEYYFWYMAHVGWVDAAGNHKRMSGRRYDERNPGEGRMITPEEIVELMNPREKPTGVASADTRDTDNDGLPDLLEFELGTNPFDFDSDGDGLPDGWELMIAGTDPLLAYTTSNVHDSLRNYDGDAMAFTTVEKESEVKPRPKYIMKPWTFAARRDKMDLNFGDSNGVQWYVMRPEDYNAGAVEFKVIAEQAEKEGGEEEGGEGGEPALVQRGTLVKTSAGSFITLGKVYCVGKKPTRLALALGQTNTFAVAKVKFDGEEIENVALEPTYLSAGTVVESVTTNTPYAKIVVSKVAKSGKCNAGWKYGQTSQSNTGIEFGMLTIGRYLDPEVNLVLTAMPDNARNVAYIHSLVYQEFGFDPRTAWSSTTPLAKRWGNSEYEDQTQSGKGGYAGKSTRTRDFTTYDEFLVHSYFVNNGVSMLGFTKVKEGDVPDWAVVWGAFTTNPQGPAPKVGEDSDITPDSPGEETGNGHYYGRNSVNGADTDGDGVPDGWELYVMSGPKEVQKDGSKKYVFAPPYDGFYPGCRNKDLGEEAKALYSYWSPFMNYASDLATDNANYVGKDKNDNLTQRQEFAGTDSCAHYKDYSTTVVMPDGQETWINKFFPTDPWCCDTDGDGIKDGAEAGFFRYEGNEDNGTAKFVAGGGLNPCTIDTDQDGLPDPWEADFAGKTLGENPADGYIDGMDGTVADALTTVGGVNRDYDHDGLENFQEYLTGTMRCWRYDDPYTTWTFIPDDVYYADGKAGDQDAFDVTNAVTKLAAAGKLETEIGDLSDKAALDKAIAEFWYKTVFDMTSEIYNPYLVTGTSPGGMYWTRVDNGWDINYADSDLDKQRPGGNFYFLRDRVNGVEFKELWNERLPLIKDNPATRYMTCSPIDYDTDHDGMDDFYELFHGLNPLLGESNTKQKSGRAFDVVTESYGGEEKLVVGDTYNNWWLEHQPREGEIAARGNQKTMDFVVYPWRNGLPEADADGDDIRNQIESIMPKMAGSSWLHTDPSALWMTDHSYSNSLVRMFYRLPRRTLNLLQFPMLRDENGELVPGIEYDGKKLYFRDTPAYVAPNGTVKVPHYGAFIPDSWGLSINETAAYNWIASFEENEGYDSDHDALSDYDEVEGKFRAASDPQDADSPHRRQAMYFPGKNAVLQTLLQSSERYPLVGSNIYPDDPSFKEFTVECWANPEVVDRDQVILERAIWTGASANADEEFIRKNFQIGIRSGRWYAKFDTNGTRADGYVDILSDEVASVGWHHLALTYDGSALTLYVNGVLKGQKRPNLQPEYGSHAIFVTEGSGQRAPADYKFDSAYSYHALVVGGSVTPQGQGGKGETIDLTSGIGWEGYQEFFQGYVDEIRIWDGARSENEIVDNMKVRYTRAMALENRTDFYAKWSKGQYRYDAATESAGVKVPAELRYHFAFDSVPGAADAADVAVAPHGFDYQSESLSGTVSGKAYYQRPEGYAVPWWTSVLESYPGTVYAHPAWIQWIPNTVTHLPRFDGTTLDSFFWSTTFAGDIPGNYTFARTAEPVSLWQQVEFGSKTGEYGAPSAAHFRAVALNADTNTTSTALLQYDFTGRHLNQSGDDLLPLGGAFVKYCKTMWDDQGASTSWEIAGSDSDNDGLPDWWDAYARANYMTEDFDPSDPLTWNTLVNYRGVTMTAGEAFRRDLAKGTTVVDGKVVEDAYPQTADEDFSDIPDWWEDLYQIAGEGGTTDTDNDGLNNRAEYVISEKYAFGVKLDPRMAASDTKTLDYFRRPVGSKLYLGEMFADHDMVEDHWERALNDTDRANANRWDALRDKDEDGWTNFDECRYNGYAMSTLPKLISHAMGDVEVLDAPTPTIKLKVRYNEPQSLVAKKEDSGKDDESQKAGINLVVLAYSDKDMTAPDATFALTPGASVAGEVYLGSWENRVVRGTMTPGHIDFASIDLKFAQVPQSDKYSWTDENGTHISGTYEEFKEALSKNPDIIQNIDEFNWLPFESPENVYTHADKAVSVTRDGNEQIGYIAIYGERVGQVDLETGEYTFDFDAMNKLSIPGIFDGEKGVKGAWGVKEAIFKLTYSAKIPDMQAKVCDVSLAKPTTGFVRGGKNTIVAFYDLDGDDYTPGVDPLGVVRDVEVGWGTTEVEVELTHLNAVTPRINLCSTANDRSERTESAVNDKEDGEDAAEVDSLGMRRAFETAKEARVRVIRYQVDDLKPFMAGVREPTVLLDRVFQLDVRNILHEGDLLAGGALDLDWDKLYDEVVESYGVIATGTPITNVNYLVVFGDDPLDFDHVTATNSNLKAHPVLVSRRFEKNRTMPTAVQESMICTESRPTFSWKIENEESWACRFGSTYTVFKIKVWEDDGKTLVFDSGYQKMPVKDTTGLYSWKAPLYVDAPSPTNGKVFKNLSNYKWQVFTYNSKFKTDGTGSAVMNLRTGVTTENDVAFEIPVRVCYVGPATQLGGKVVVQAFRTPDFVGQPEAQAVVANVTGTALDPVSRDVANVTLTGLKAGSYYLCAYIDTDGDMKRSSWESWGYLSARDRASVGGTKGIFTPVPLTVGIGMAVPAVRVLYVEDCDTNGNGFPDVWEAEQNSGKFDPNRIAPSKGDVAQASVNPTLTNNLSTAEYPYVAALASEDGVRLVTGFKSVRSNGNGGFLVMPEIVANTVCINGFTVMASEKKIVLSVGAETVGTVAEGIASICSITVAEGATATVRVLHTETLAGDWRVVAEKSGVVIGGDGTQLDVEFDSELPKGGFFKLVIVQ